MSEDRQGIFEIVKSLVLSINIDESIKNYVNKDLVEKVVKLCEVSPGLDRVILLGIRKSAPKSAEYLESLLV
jgi:hypothetical protein